MRVLFECNYDRWDLDESPTGSGWYDEGSVATFQVDEVSAERLVVHIFQEWTGDIRATTPKALVAMNSPKEVKALWKTDHTRTYIILGFFSAMVAFAGVIAYRVYKTRKKRPHVRRRYQTPLTLAPHRSQYRAFGRISRPQ